VKVRAIAVATERSNAVGMVELECTPHGLSIAYLGVASFSEGYAPGAVTSGTRILVPWSAVREARLEGEQVFLALDPAATPHHRVVLVNFSTGDAIHHREAHRQRLIVRAAALGLGAVTVAFVAVALPRLAPRAGPGAALAVGALGALAVLLLGLLAEQRVVFGGRDARAAREAFVAELALFLPGILRLEAPLPSARPAPVPIVQRLLPRTTTAIVVVASACLLGAILTLRWMLAERERPAPRAPADPRAAPAEPRGRAALADPPDPPAVAARAEPPAAEPAPRAAEPAAVAEPAPAAAAQAHVERPCTCARADSLLWQDPIPKLSLLTLARRPRPGGSKPRIEIDIAVVNNGAEEIRELSIPIELTMQDPPPSSKRYATDHRAVYYQGPLGPGQAVKWTVEGKGTGFEARSPITATLGPAGEGAAPTNLLAELLRANHRPVRLHGAMMLAYLGDPRARDAALELREALREEEAPYLERLVAATAETRVCGLAVAASGERRDVRACVHNTGGEPRSGLVLRVRALAARPGHGDPVGPPPPVNAETQVSIPGAIGARSGVATSFVLDEQAVKGVAIEALVE
jgi:hypothetical protein